MNNETKRLSKKYSHNHIISASLSDFNRKTLFTTIPFFQESVDAWLLSLTTFNLLWLLWKCVAIKQLGLIVHC